MFNDSFKGLYKNVPLAVWVNNGGAINSNTHNHTEMEISLRMRGKCECTVNNKTFIAKEGDIIINNPFEIHSARSLDDLVVGYCICFDCSLIADEKLVEALKNGSIRVTNYIDSSCRHNAELKKLFMDIIECYERNNKYIYLEIKARISLLFAFLLNNGYVDTSYKKTKDEDFYQKVLQYTSENYGENITSKDVADALSYNHSYFCRKFRKGFSRSFHDYLNMYRVVESKKLLEKGDNTIAQISSECGFMSQTYFTECFKKYIGVLPSEYRQKVNPESIKSQ